MAHSWSWIRNGLFFLLVSSPLQAETRLIFPRVIFQKDHWIGVALANPTSTDAQVTLTAYNLDGTLFTGAGVTNPATKPIAKGSQYVALAFQIFLPDSSPLTSSDTPTRLWMEVKSTTDGITGFFLEGHSPTGVPDYLAGSDLSGYGSDLAIPIVENVSPSVTELSVVNPDTAKATLSIDFLKADGTKVADPDNSHDVPAQGGLQGPLSELFPKIDFSHVAALRIRSNSPVHCYGSVFRMSDPSLVTIAGQNATLPGKTLQFPQLAEGAGWATSVGVQNLTNASVLVTITAYQSDGTLFSAPVIQSSNPITREIAAGGVFSSSLKELFSMSPDSLQTGWLKVETAAPAIIGYVEYGAGTTRALVPAQITTYTNSYFSYQYLGSPYFTGLGVLNPTSLSTNVAVTSLDSSGAPIGKSQRILKPGEKQALTMQQWVAATNDNPRANGGSVLVQSDNPVTATQLWGTQTFTALANISPQQVSGSYNPSGGLGSLTVKPPLAVVESGKSIPFSTQSGAPSVTWSVQNGDPAYGTITASGLYKAPAAAPSQHNVTIQAATSDGTLSAGATVDVVQREILIGNLTLLTAVAYLNDIQRFYTAEQQVLSSEPQVGYAATSNTKITSFTSPSSGTLCATITGDTISKMIPLVDGGKYYLLLLGFDTGRIYRLPVNAGSCASYSTVYSGLNKPSSMALDLSGNLLVSQSGSNQIIAVSRSQLLSEALPPGQAEALTAPDALSILVPSAPMGVAVNPCTGAVYASLANGTLHEYRGSFDRVLASGLTQPGQIMVLFRVGFGCPDGLAIALEEAGNVVLIIPSKNLVTTMVGGIASTNDLTFFPEGNPFTSEASLIIGENWPGTGNSKVSYVRVGGLYYLISPVPPPSGGLSVPYLDPVGDTFSTSVSQGLTVPDIISFSSKSLGTLTPFGQVGSPYAAILLTFASPVAPISPPQANSIKGSIYLNTGSTGVQVSTLNSYNSYFQDSGLGVNYEVSIDRQKLINLATNTEVDIIVHYFGTTVEVLILNQYLDLSKVRPKAIVLLGNSKEMTDVAPNSLAVQLAP